LDERIFLGSLCTDTSVNVRFRLKDITGATIASYLLLMHLLRQSLLIQL
jgi:hypothetical protein